MGRLIRVVKGLGDAPRLERERPGPAGSPRDGASRPVARRNLSGEVVDRIRGFIFDGTLKAGQRVPQDAIARDLGVSRLPVREALISLEAEGLVVSEPHRGTYVVPILQEDIADHYRVYGMAQGLAARRAATRITAPTMERLKQLHERMRQTEDESELHSLNWEFHALINQTGGSRRLLSVLRQLARNLPREVYEVAPGADPEASRDHQELIEALEAGDGSRADALSRQHMAREADFVIAKLKRDGILADNLD